MAEQDKLKITCGKVDCENGLHCYRVTKKEATSVWNRLQQGSPGSGGSKRMSVGLALEEIPLDEQGKPKEGPVKVCKACGAALVDWSRVHMQDLQDIEYTFRALKTEWIRHLFWHWSLDEQTQNYAYKKGVMGMRERVMTRIHKYIGRAPATELWHDGRQTPFADKPDAQNIIYCAQHATATCCRKCVELWHKIPLDRALTDAEETYLTELAMRYILDRLPNLTETGGLKPAEASSLATGLAPDSPGAPSANTVARHTKTESVERPSQVPSAISPSSKVLATRRRSLKPRTQ